MRLFEPTKQEMRSYICISHEGTPFKLVWVNEDSNGVYLGLYGAARGTHFSYHADGTKHFKSPDSPDPQQQLKGIQISSIDPFQQIVFQGFQLSSSTMYIAGNVYQKEDQASSTAIFLDESIFTDNSVAIDAHLINRKKEPDFIKYVYSKPYEGRYKIVTCNIFTLTNFPTHKIGLVILSGEGIMN